MIIECYDIGGTKIKGALITEGSSYKILHQLQVNSERGNPEKLLQQVKGMSKQLRSKLKQKKIDAVSIGLPGPVKDGVLQVSPPLHLHKPWDIKRGFKEFHSGFVYLSEDAARYLAGRGIKTLGVDSLSVQKFHSGNQVVHNIIISSMTLFEGLDLSKVPPGEYIFVGLPLKIKGCDGAPARAILISKE